MSEQKGIEQTKEAIVGLLEVSAMLAEVFKDGLQASDAMEVFAKIKGNPELESKLVAAYNQIDQVPSELKDISLAEGVELVMASLPAFKKLISSVKK